MLVLDTDGLPARARAEAFQSAISGNASRSTATFEPDLPVRATVHLLDLGPGRVFNVQATGNTLHRTALMARREERSAVALALPTFGRNVFRSGRHEAVITPRDLLLVDLDRPYEYGWRGAGSSYAFQVDRECLALDPDVVLRAVPRLASSPLYAFVRDHVRDVTRSAEQWSGSARGDQLGEATLVLMRALVVGAAGDRATVEATRSAVLMIRVTTYARRNLRDPGLTPHDIAVAHGVSTRHLYQLCARHEIRLERWILHARLDGARTALAEPRNRRRPIHAIAGGWGFTNASFFSARFRAAYGPTPRDWQRTQATIHDGG